MADSDEDTLWNAIKQRIPGYGAYIDQEARRHDDRLTREFLAQRLGQSLKKLEEKAAKAVAEGDLNLPLVIEQLRQRIDLGRSRITAAVEGYASWFGERKVDADLLKQVATHDANLISLVDQLDQLASQVDVGTAGVLSELREAIELLHARLDRRHEMLRGGL